jgi:hypothetical protein
MFITPRFSGVVVNGAGCVDSRYHKETLNRDYASLVQALEEKGMDIGLRSGHVSSDMICLYTADLVDKETGEQRHDLGSYSWVGELVEKLQEFL